MNSRTPLFRSICAVREVELSCVICRPTPRRRPPIERVWRHLNETITRNHRCRTLEELLDQAYAWFAEHDNHLIDMRRSFTKAE